MYKAINELGKKTIKRIPQLTFKKRVLIPYDTYAAGSLVVLYYMPGTRLPKNIEVLKDQLEAQGFTLLGIPSEDGQKNLVVRCMKKGDE